MIKNVVIVGLGGVGAVYASKLPMAKILVNKERFERYKSSPTVINGVIHEFDYVTECPKNPDLIIVSTGIGVHDAHSLTESCDVKDLPTFVKTMKETIFQISKE